MDEVFTELKGGIFPPGFSKQLHGYEMGQVETAPGPTQGNFTSVRYAVSADGCWAEVLRFKGHIDLSGVLGNSDDPVDSDYGVYGRDDQNQRSLVLRFC